MIDIESKVFDTLNTALQNAFLTTYPNLSIYSEYVETPSGFPSISIVEDDNYVLKSSAIGTSEEHSVLMYSVNIYTNNASGKKSLARSIASVVDSTFASMKFTRTMMSQTPNIDRSIYRITMQYEGVVGKGITSGTTTTYQMYRNK